MSLRLLLRHSTFMLWKTSFTGTAGTLLLLSGCAGTGTSASFSPEEIHVSQAQLAVSSPALAGLETMTGSWTVSSRWWPNAKASRARTSEGSAQFRMSADGSTLIGDMNVGVGKSTLQSALLVGVDASTEKYAMGWADTSGQEILPMCLSVEGSPQDRMYVERSAGTGMVRDQLSEVSSSHFRFVRYRVLANGAAFRELELVGRR